MAGSLSACTFKENLRSPEVFVLGKADIGGETRSLSRPWREVSPPVHLKKTSGLRRFFVLGKADIVGETRSLSRHRREVSPPLLKAKADF